MADNLKNDWNVSDMADGVKNSSANLYCLFNCLFITKTTIQIWLELADVSRD
jgi:hypothetical protein